MQFSNTGINLGIGRYDLPSNHPYHTEHYKETLRMISRVARDLVDCLGYNSALKIVSSMIEKREGRTAKEDLVRSIIISIIREGLIEK